jgi:nitroimidazol reductase NimA-like FMN-containing flavoprotein (pyridoxamine 5'-phosphate oxidase superfamily)
MTSLKMSVEEREAFLADLHVGVISIRDPDPARAPVSAPIWYDFAPEVGVWVLTSPTSRKGEALKAAGRYSLVAQNEAMPYRYVSVEGPVVEERVAELERDLRPMARRYFGVELGDAYAESNEGGNVYVMRPERWLTVDYGKLQPGG